MRREVVDICVLIFIADVVTGVQIPVFPLYTISLGASLGLLGLITAVLGLGRLASALPVGMLSDRLDRKTVLVGGMIAFALSFVLYAFSPSAEWLALPRAIQAIAMVATFPLGIAYIGDVARSATGVRRSAYTAAMGSVRGGTSAGSWVGSVADIAAYLPGRSSRLSERWRAALISTKVKTVENVTAPAVDLPASPPARQPAMVSGLRANIAMTSR
jgi:MFS family permease